jgi:signal transduction histidine kinase
VQPAHPVHGAAVWWTKAVVVVLLALPALLVVFAATLTAVTRRTARALVALWALEVVVTAAVPALPDGKDPHRPGWWLPYAVLVLATWAVQSAVAARGLWRAGHHQSAVVRRRMRSLAAGAVVLAVTLIAVGITGSSEVTVVRLAVLVAGLLSVLLFAVTFLLPTWLRVAWRQEDLAALSDAERGLMTALTAQEVADTIVPALRAVFGGAAALVDDAGQPVTATAGGRPVDAVDPALLVSASDGAAQHDAVHGALVARADSLWLVVRAGRLAPVFGDDEAVLLGRVATLVALALQRVRLFERETASRQAAEVVSADLETLLYSVSHDLRSPLISVLGYLDVLRLEHSDALSGDGPHYLERISVNALYMQSLIADLLELSRIGRADAPADALDLQSLAEEVADAAALTHPAARIEVLGPLPVVRTNDVRTRQLLTNLVDNALNHGGRPDVRVTVSARTTAGWLVVEVVDDGRGIPAEYRTRVLRVFERLDAPKSSPGTGMGLAICKRIVESIGGSIEVDGAPPDAASGTTVRLLLPDSVVVDRPLPAPRTSPDEAPDPAPLDARPVTAEERR